MSTYRRSTRARLQRRIEAARRACTRGRAGSVGTIGVALFAAMGWRGERARGAHRHHAADLVRRTAAAQQAYGWQRQPLRRGSAVRRRFHAFRSGFINALGGTSSVGYAVSLRYVVVTDTTSRLLASAPPTTTRHWPWSRAGDDSLEDDGQSRPGPSVGRPERRPHAGAAQRRSSVYWARVTMTRALNRWNPVVGPHERPALGAAVAARAYVSRPARHQFPAGTAVQALLLSSFDVFTLPAPGTNGTDEERQSVGGHSAVAGR